MYRNGRRPYHGEMEVVFVRTQGWKVFLALVVTGALASSERASAQVISGFTNSPASVTTATAPFYAPQQNQAQPGGTTNNYYVLPSAAPTLTPAQPGGSGTNQAQPPAGVSRSAVSPAGYSVTRYRQAGPPPPPTGPQPAAAELAPPGTRKLQSLSGERLYLDGGIRVKLAGIVFPKGAAGNPTRAAIKDTIRTAYLQMQPADNSPPRGDAEYTVWLTLPNGRDVSLELVSRGVAAVSHAASFRTTEERGQFIAAETDAKNRRLGIWAR